MDSGIMQEQDNITTWIQRPLFRLQGVVAKSGHPCCSLSTASITSKIMIMKAFLKPSALKPREVQY